MLRRVPRLALEGLLDRVLQRRRSVGNVADADRGRHRLQQDTVAGKLAPAPITGSELGRRGTSAFHQPEHLSV
jgi:hypothetical protein